MKLRKISLAYIILFLVAISVSISIDAGDLESHILEYGALYELKISELPANKDLKRGKQNGTQKKLLFLKPHQHSSQ